MSVNVPTIYAQQFATNIELLLQQEGSRLIGAVDYKTGYVGKQASPVDQMGSVAAQKVETRFEAMPRVDATFARRWVFPVNYDLPQLIDQFDKLRLLTDPTSLYVQNAMNAMGRAMDAEIINAFFDDAKTGETAGDTTTFTAGNIVPVQFGAAADTGLTVAKLKEAKRLLMKANVNLDTEMLFCAITADEHDDLLNEIEIVHKDYTDKPVLAGDGRVRSYLGINFIHTELVEADANSDHLVPLWCKSGVHLAGWMPIHTEISMRNDLRGTPWQAYALGTFGATRLQEPKVIQIIAAN